MSSWDFLVARTDLRQAKVAPAAPHDLAEGEARLAIERFALTANNITYAVFGDAMRYWDFFPAPEGWGRVPVWGHATVEASNHPELAVGQRFYGYYPMSTHLTVTPRRTRTGFADAAPHRADLPPVYNQYRAAAPSPLDDHQALLQPLFITGFLIEDFLDENDLFGARSVVLTSASSKTAISLAFQLKQRGKARVVGLTSARNAAFVAGLGFYDQVVTYDAVTDAPIEAPAVLVDFAGDAPLRRAVHERFGEALAYSCVVGGTHWEAGPSGGDRLPGPKPIFFFAPDRIRKRAADWGPGGLDERHDAAWAPFVADATRWMTVRHGVGPAAVAEVYQAVLEGRAGPEAGHILQP
jgi:hypothetical protein